MVKHVHNFMSKQISSNQLLYSVKKENIIKNYYLIRKTKFDKKKRVNFIKNIFFRY